MPRKKEYLVLRSFDWSPRPNVVQAYKAGKVVSGLTRTCVARGLASKALQPLNRKERPNG